MKRNKTILNKLPGDLYLIEANDNISNNCKYPLALIQAAQNHLANKNRRFTRTAQVKN